VGNMLLTLHIVQNVATNHEITYQSHETSSIKKQSCQNNKNPTLGHGRCNMVVVLIFFEGSWRLVEACEEGPNLLEGRNPSQSAREKQAWSKSKWLQGLQKTMVATTSHHYIPMVGGGYPTTSPSCTLINGRPIHSNTSKGCMMMSYKE
jgi:hypothetical protein